MYDNKKPRKVKSFETNCIKKTPSLEKVHFAYITRSSKSNTI